MKTISPVIEFVILVILTRQPEQPEATTAWVTAVEMLAAAASVSLEPLNAEAGRPLSVTAPAATTVPDVLVADADGLCVEAAEPVAAVDVVALAVAEEEAVAVADEEAVAVLVSKLEGKFVTDGIDAVGSEENDTFTEAVGNEDKDAFWVGIGGLLRDGTLVFDGKKDALGAIEALGKSLNVTFAETDATAIDAVGIDEKETFEDAEGTMEVEPIVEAVG